MDNPLKQPAPEDPIARVHAFARDLAWGAVNGRWGSHFEIELNPGSPEKWGAPSSKKESSANLNIELKRKWGNTFLESNLLRSFGYFVLDNENSSLRYKAFSLSQKSFTLLEKPAIPPKIFISYRQKESSPFALLIEARLTLADPTIGIFIDKLIEGGAAWLERIEKEVLRCDKFIIVYGPDTPNSGTILKEIAWAEKTGSTIIPVLHHGFTRDSKGYPEQFKALNDITVEKEGVKAYENAITDILIALGYSTLQSPRPAAATG